MTVFVVKYFSFDLIDFECEFFEDDEEAFRWCLEKFKIHGYSFKEKEIYQIGYRPIEDFEDFIKQNPQLD